MNTYSRLWFELFLATQPNTDKEVTFIARHLPRPPYKLVLDLCCGQGRHTNLLALYGYEMVGIDLNAEAIQEAKRYASPTTVYLQQDMRQLAQVPFTFDAALCLWQSFGYFDEATNRDLLGQIAQKLNSRGRLILDLYNRDYFMEHQGTRCFSRQGIDVIAMNIMHGHRLTALLQYSNGRCDAFEWQLYTAEEITDLAHGLGFQCIVACSDFAEQPVTPEVPRMQFVFEQIL